MDKDIARQVAQLREEIAAFDPGRDPIRIGIKQTHAGALLAISLASRHGFVGVARTRSARDRERERAMCDAVLNAVKDWDETPAGDWFGDFAFGSALLRVAATIHGTLKHRYLSLFGEGFCRSRTRLEEQAYRDGLILEADRRLLAAIRDDAGAYKHDRSEPRNRAETSLNDLVVGLRVVVGVARGFPDLPQAKEARG